MRLKKDPSLIDIDVKTDRVNPFRTILLDEDEIRMVQSVALNESSEASEKILLDILKRRGMGRLLYSDKKIEQWSGFVMLKGNELWLV